MIDEEFNYSLLFVVIGALVAANVIFKSYLGSKKAKKEFMLH